MVRNRGSLRDNLEVFRHSSIALSLEQFSLPPSLIVLRHISVGISIAGKTQRQMLGQAPFGNEVHSERCTLLGHVAPSTV